MTDDRTTRSPSNPQARSRNQARVRGMSPLRRERGRRDERGAALVEFALVFTLLVFLLYGLISFGMILAAKQGITNAASEGARAAIGAVDPQQTAQDQARSAMAWIGADKLTAIDAVPTVAPCVGAPTSQCITMKVTYRYADKPIVPPAPGLGLVTPDEFSSSATVQIGA